ncbi:MAG: hypothetical protein OXG15_02385 [Gammaproteobacteria bacterium]|nr:hypothetical protein [Gammaproteobacteria bacterium]
MIEFEVGDEVHHAKPNPPTFGLLSMVSRLARGGYTRSEREENAVSVLLESIDGAPPEEAPVNVQWKAVVAAVSFFN